MSSVFSEGHFVESLEARVTPAVYLTDVPDGAPTIVDPSTVTYRDVDGDMVTVKFSKELFSSQGVVDAIFDFSEPVDIGYGVKGYELNGISLLPFASDPKFLRDLDITVTAESVLLEGVDSASVPTENGSIGYYDWVKVPFGDGHANVGFIEAAEILGTYGTDLGDVSIDGNLGKIIVGDSKTSNGGLRSLTVLSLGTPGDASDVHGAEYTSVIRGAVKNLDIAGNLSGAVLNITGGKHGDLLNAHIGGDILGGAYMQAGSIHVDGTIKSLTIDGSIIAGEGDYSGSVYAADDIKSLSVGGDLRGGSDSFSGSVVAKDRIGKISITGDLIGGLGYNSGSVVSYDGKIAKIDHDGMANPGTGKDSGKFLSFINKPVVQKHHGGGYVTIGEGSGSGTYGATLTLYGGTFHAGSMPENYIRDFEDGSSATAGGAGGLIKTGGGTLTLSGGLSFDTNGNAIGESGFLFVDSSAVIGGYTGTLLDTTHDLSGSLLDLSLAGVDAVSTFMGAPANVWSV